MESRLSLYRKKRSKKTIYITILFVSIVFFTTFFFINKLLPGTFAFYTAEVQSSGTISNASSSDLIEVDTGKIDYEKNCKIKSSITIRNKSTIEIPITIELLTKNGGNHSTSTLLKPNSIFSTNPNDTDQLPNRCEFQEIKYRIVGFNGYVDEIYTLPVDQRKLAESKDSGKVNTLSLDMSNQIKP